MNDTNSALEVMNLTKRYKNITAVDHINFSVHTGELFGFLGPNGAGKTTTINMLTGLARLDEGTIHISGIDCTRNPKAAQHLTGIVPDESNLYPELSGFDNLCFCASLYGIRKKERERRARELLSTFGLDEAADRKFAAYSKGMKRKLTFAAGIIHQPSILFLDEPTTGIDVASARQVRQIIADLHRNGTTVFLTTHYIEEAERLCERIAFIVKGKVIRIDTIPALLQPVKGRHTLVLSISDMAGITTNELSGAFPEYRFTITDTGQIHVDSATSIAVGPLVHYFEERHIDITEARKVHPSLEDVFVQLTGIEADLMRKEKERAGGGQ